MKRLSVSIFALVFAATFSQVAVALAQGQGMTNLPTADFGSPPSGQIPILFNDHHVYAKPDTLKQGRVLAALVRGGTVLIPLRSMFEQMGATVSYDAGSKTVDVSKAGSDVRVTVGRPEVVINGESRPLDVPPIMYQGHVLVPIRVISEGMGAYVQWVPDKQTVVVRYVYATPPPTPTPSPPPPPEPAPVLTPTPAPAPTPWIKAYIAGDYLSPRVYNEFSSGQGTNNQDGFSYAIHGNAEFSLAGIPLIAGGSFTQYNYAHTCAVNASGVYAANCYVTTLGNAGSTAVPAFTVRNYLGDAHVGLNFFFPRVYMDIGYMWIGNNAGYPWMKGQGTGLEIIPDPDRPFSVYGNYTYYGNVSGTTAAINTGVAYKIAYIVTRYDVGATYSFLSSPLFVEAGYKGDAWHERYNVPGSVTEGGPYVGLGLHF